MEDVLVRVPDCVRDRRDVVELLVTDAVADAERVEECDFADDRVAVMVRVLVAEPVTDRVDVLAEVTVPVAEAVRVEVCDRDDVDEPVSEPVGGDVRVDVAEPVTVCGDMSGLLSMTKLAPQYPSTSHVGRLSGRRRSRGTCGSRACACTR